MGLDILLVHSHKRTRMCQLETVGLIVNLHAKQDNEIDIWTFFYQNFLSKILKALLIYSAFTKDTLMFVKVGFLFMAGFWCLNPTCHRVFLLTIMFVFSQLLIGKQAYIFHTSDTNFTTLSYYNSAVRLFPCKIKLTMTSYTNKVVFAAYSCYICH